MRVGMLTKGDGAGPVGTSGVPVLQHCVILVVAVNDEARYIV